MEQLGAEFEGQFRGRHPLAGGPFPWVGREKNPRMLEHERLILASRHHLALYQVALARPVLGQCRLKKVQARRGVAGIDGSQNLFATNAKVSGRIAKRRNLLRRSWQDSLDHCWFSGTSGGELAVEVTGRDVRWKIRFTRWRK